jgi:hypothetical protein
MEPQNTDPCKKNRSKIQAMDMKLYESNEGKIRRDRTRNELMEKIEF